MKRIFLVLGLYLLLTSTANAAPSYKSTLSAARNLRKSEVKLAKSIAGLSAADREKLKTALASLGVDTDKDGVSDLFEKARGSNICDNDSDDDGVDDNDDGYEDDQNRLGEVESKGAVTSFQDPTLIVGGKTFTVTATTSFRKGVSSKADLVTGACIKVEGYTDPSNVNIATKVEKYDRCSGGNGEDDDKDDDKGR
jgi:hypothetical protein